MRNSSVLRRNPKPTLLLVLQLLAFWPVWRWYAARILDPSGEPWGLLALGTAAVFCGWKKSEAGTAAMAGSAKPTWIPPVLLMLLYTATYPLLPPLLRAGIAVTAIACTVSPYRLGTPLHLGIWGLLLGSLPIVPSLQFYLGYPLRTLVAALAAPLLQLTGFAVVREGTLLNWGGRLIWIDAPCSGIRTLWAGLYLTFTLASFYGLGPWKTWLAALLSLLAVILGNILRSAALFYVEAGILALPLWAHQGVGLVTFLFTTTFIVGFIQWIRKEIPCDTPLSS